MVAIATEPLEVQTEDALRAPSGRSPAGERSVLRTPSILENLRSLVVGITVAFATSCQASQTPPTSRTARLDALAESLARIAGTHVNDEDCHGGAYLGDNARREVIGPLGACQTKLGDTTFYTYSELGGRLRVVGQRYHVSSADLLRRADSVMATLSRVYGPGETCPSEVLGGPYIARYHRWPGPEYDIQLHANSMELPGWGPSITIEAQNIAPVCGQWAGEPVNR